MSRAQAPARRRHGSRSIACWTVAVACGLLWVTAAPAQPGTGLGPPPVPVGSLQIQHIERTPVTGDVVHYRYDLQVGPGAYDRIEVHRLVREKPNHRPVRTRDGVLLVPGLPQTFEAIFMPPTVSEVPGWERSVAVFLAQHDFDVWGVTFGWAFVPLEATDFAFMAGWGAERDARDTEIALILARVMRTLTGQGPGRLHLLGFSYGADLGYSVAGAESQWPPQLRNVKGLIVVDGAPLLPEGHPWRLEACDYLYYWVLPSLEGGIFQDDQSYLSWLADLAIDFPDDESPILPPLTNYQAILALGIPGTVAGDPDTLETFYTEPRLFMDLFRAAPPYATMEAFYDYAAGRCGDPAYDPAYDDDIGGIALPILYVGGWVGEIGYFTLDQTASEDISRVLIEGDQGSFGHFDLFLAQDAPTLVWQPIADWLLDHR